jgi:hypothetical protein
MGIVKLAFVTPAMMSVAIPHDALLMMGFLPIFWSQISGRSVQGRTQEV